MQTPFEAVFRTTLSLFDSGYESRLYNPPTGIMYYPVIYFVFILDRNYSNYSYHEYVDW